MILVIKIMLTKAMTKEEKGITVKVDPKRYINAQKICRIVFIGLAIFTQFIHLISHFDTILKN